METKYIYQISGKLEISSCLLYTYIHNSTLRNSINNNCKILCTSDNFVSDVYRKFFISYDEFIEYSKKSCGIWFGIHLYENKLEEFIFYTSDVKLYSLLKLILK